MPPYSQPPPANLAQPTQLGSHKLSKSEICDSMGLDQHGPGHVQFESTPTTLAASPMQQYIAKNVAVAVVLFRIYNLYVVGEILNLGFNFNLQCLIFTKNIMR
jgi:hypothetical protein